MLDNKIAITFDSFDVLDRNKKNLIHQMRKVAYEGKVIVSIFDDFTTYSITGSFPVQELLLRKKNINYFVDSIEEIKDKEMFLENLEDYLEELKTEYGMKIVYVGYDDNKDFIGRSIIKKMGIPVKFIKKIQK